MLRKSSKFIYTLLSSVVNSLKIRHIVIFLLCSIQAEIAFAQIDIASVNNFLTSRISSFISEETEETELNIVEPLSSYLIKLDRVKSQKGNSPEFLHSIFYKTHRKFLKQYDSNATFSDMMSSGKYGCVPGTALYAILLDYFEFDYKILELPNHVFLTVSLNGKGYLFESTDPSYGLTETTLDFQEFDKQNGQIARKTSTLTSVGANGISNTRGFINTQLTLNQLAGLQYFNRSIYAHNGQDYLEALEMSERALMLYDSNRTRKMMQFVISTILRSKKISGKDKKKYLKQYISQVQKKKLSQTL